MLIFPTPIICPRFKSRIRILPAPLPRPFFAPALLTDVTDFHSFSAGTITKKVMYYNRKKKDCSTYAFTCYVRLLKKLILTTEVVLKFLRLYTVFRHCGLRLIIKFSGLHKTLFIANNLEVILLIKRNYFTIKNKQIPLIIFDTDPSPQNIITPAHHRPIDHIDHRPSNQHRPTQH